MYNYSANLTNNVSALYILINYINRTVVIELQVAKNCNISLFGTLNQDRKFKERMASI
jgi:hypothetical protein